MYTSQESENGSLESENERREGEFNYYRDEYVLYPNAGYNGEVIAEDDLTSNGGYESGDEWSSGDLGCPKIS